MAYSRVQQRALTNAMLMGLPVKDLKNPDYSEDVMLDIIECLEIGVDPVFCKCGKFNKAQRREIIYGLDGQLMSMLMLIQISTQIRCMKLEQD